MNRQQEKITALYCRIDSGKQNELDAQYGQIQSLLDYARQHGLPNPHFFCDWGYSGTTADRPEYCRMLQAVTSGHVANLVVAKLDRLIREREPYYAHTLEGDDDMPAHAKSTLAGVSLTIPITAGRLNLGLWQGVYLCEFRNHGGARRIVATVVG